VSCFATALGASTDPASLRLAWLAGLLEAEGTFLRPPPSTPNCPVVACRMTDCDVVERVAACFGTKVQVVDKGRYRTEYASIIKGGRAVALMADLAPLMGDRRRGAIKRAMRAYLSPHRKLSFELAEEIRHRFDEGESIASLARTYGVRPQTVRPLLRGELYGTAPSLPWREALGDLRPLTPPPELTQAEFYWLAGWLEGEGSFMAPPPSDPRRVRISAQAKDQDVVSEASRLCRVTPSYDYSKRTRSRGWSPTWRLLVRGSRAALFMKRLSPILGVRRNHQIASALDVIGRNHPSWRRRDSNPGARS
jgi:hypothetical protein